MAERAILHSDLNSFYASVEIMLDPRLRGKPIAVCGATEERHGIVLAKSDPAKKAGVKTGMINQDAMRCCPGLILVPPQYDQYLKYSKLTRAIYQRYTDQIEPFGMDECWLDVTHSSIHGSPVEIAEKIRKSVREELGLTVSIGVSFNKIFAKLGSDMKKPDAITEITPENFREKVWPLNANEMIYVGVHTYEKLRRFGIHTIGEMASVGLPFMKRNFGINGEALWYAASGLDCSRVMQDGYRREVKSVGHGITCVCDLSDNAQVKKVIYELSQDIGHKLRKEGLRARKIEVSASGYSNGQRYCEVYSSRLEKATEYQEIIAECAYRTFAARFPWNATVRNITVRAADLIPGADSVQLSFFDNLEAMEKREMLQEALEDIRSRFGKSSIRLGITMGDLLMPSDGREKARMPSPMYR